LQVAPDAHVIGVPTQAWSPTQKISHVLPVAHMRVVLSHVWSSAHLIEHDEPSAQVMPLRHD
jgi:hypothetical protein